MEYMENSSLTLKQAYHQALVNPEELTQADFDLLIAKFPYSQPLHFAYERRRFLRGELNVLQAKAILMARNPSWLYDYVQLSVTEVPSLDVIDDDYVPFEELEFEENLTTVEEEQVAEQEEEIVEEEVLAETDEVEEVEEEEIAEEPLASIVQKDEVSTLETLVQEGIGGGDYFALHAREERLKAEALAEVKAVEAVVPLFEDTAEDVSLYNDDLMPYTFRWWLHKTRLEHAGTYQPFANPTGMQGAPLAFDPAKQDKLVLDQQIRQNIIHFQSPEDKLSEEVKQRAVAVPVEPNKGASVIERFIREEPQIQPPSVDYLNTENKARKSSEEQFDLVTETLASIYANQAMYVKAIEVYKKLILKYPEKKSYFADRIKELEEKLY